MRTTFAAAAAAIGVIAAGSAEAHGGGLDSKGCHHDRKNGGYHCHRPQVAPAPQPQTPRERPQEKPQALREASGEAFPNCSAARAAGAAPVRRGDPGYGSHLDRDGDGVACE